MKIASENQKNALKNLQVSCSAYRKNIFDLTVELQDLETELESLVELEKELFGLEHMTVQNRITQIKYAVLAIKGKIAYKEGRIAYKTLQIEEIHNTINGYTNTEVMDIEAIKAYKEKVKAKAVMLAAKREAKKNGS